MLNPSKSIWCVALLSMLLAFASSAFAAPPKTLWELDYDGTYSLHPRGQTRPGVSFDEAKKALAAGLQKGEWFMEATFREIPPEAERKELHAIVKRLGGISATGDVLSGTIVGLKKDYLKGFPRKLTIDLDNRSPYRLRVTAIKVGGCGHAVQTLAQPLTIEPKAKKRMQLVIEEASILKGTPIPANCMRGDGWGSVMPVFDVV